MSATRPIPPTTAAPTVSCDPTRMTSATRAALLAAGLDPDDMLTVVQRALDEDLGSAGDITTAATVPAHTTMNARYVARRAGVAAGMPVLAALVETCLGATAGLDVLAGDGDGLNPGDELATISGNARGILAIERLSLNLISHLSGIATTTRTWVDAIASTQAKIRDTRKTTPGLRELEKYAVRCGGGVNHRRGLYDAILIKDNHIGAAGSITAALENVHGTDPTGSVGIQIEIDDESQLREALEHGARQILLDNFAIAELSSAVRIVRSYAPDALIEASGGLSIGQALRVAQTGVDFLAVGALTHSAPALDISLDIDLTSS
jgi:nicotinate-nucleotide pyrophosphorylase (carboxylating)